MRWIRIFTQKLGGAGASRRTRPARRRQDDGTFRLYELVVANSAELDACASDAGARRLIRSVLQRRSRRCRWPRHHPPPRAPAGGYVVPPSAARNGWFSRFLDFGSTLKSNQILRPRGELKGGGFDCFDCFTDNLLTEQVLSVDKQRSMQNQSVMMVRGAERLRSKDPKKPVYRAIAVFLESDSTGVSVYG